MIMRYGILLSNTMRAGATLWRPAPREPPDNSNSNTSKT